MERIVTKVEPRQLVPLQRKRVAAYARVSLGTEHMLHSLSAQVSYYSNYIQKHGEWEYVGVYADYDQTGTKDNRPEFQRLLADCRAGKIDMVITKSISRFARNTITLLSVVREFKDLGIDVHFEEQSIHTLSSEGELLLTILASYAQEESRSVSENIKWRKRNDMRRGKTAPTKVYGYAVCSRKLIVIPEQAEVIRMMFDDYLAGMGQGVIASKLNGMGITTAEGYLWSSATVRNILTNPKMCGDLLLQRKFTVDHLSKKQKLNHGELPMYLIEDAHEAIVTRDTFEAVQNELHRRGNIGTVTESVGVVFRKKIECAVCGKRFCHTSNGKGAAKHRAWSCGGRDKRTGVNCVNLQIPEPTLMIAASEALGIHEFDSDIFSDRVEKIMAHEGRRLTFIFKDGSETVVAWTRRKTIPYSVIGFEKREGRNICYSKIGLGNGKIGERRKWQEAQRSAQCKNNPSKEI